MEFRDIVNKYRGELIVQRAIVPAELARLGRELAKAAKQDAERKS
jgi:hypothetical protein